MSTIVSGLTTPLTINSSAGVIFYNTAGTAELGNSCNINNAGVFNCSGLTISNTLTCTNIIITTSGSINCLGNLNCNNLLNMNNNSITGCNSLACTSLSCTALTCTSLSCIGDTNVNRLAFTDRGSTIKSIRCINVTIGTGAAAYVHKTCTYGVTYPDAAKLFFCITFNRNSTNVTTAPNAWYATIASITTIDMIFIIRAVGASWSESLLAQIIITEIA